MSFYASVFDTPTVLTDWAEPYQRRVKFQEIIRRTAFDQSLASGRVVSANLNHNDAFKWSDTASGLVLQPDDFGLFATAYAAQNPAGELVLAELGSDKITGSSVMFRITDAKWTDGPVPTCEILAAELYDVTLAVYPEVPAYDTGEVHVRTVRDEVKIKLEIEKIKNRYRR